MLASIERLNANRPTGVALRMGIALHAGLVLIGTIGTPSRRQYTVVGDAVNVTHRLEKLNKELDSVIVASAEALARAEAGELGFRGPRWVEIRGRDEPIAVHYLPRDAAAPPGQ
jgi:adenylate cyclase